MSNCEVVNATNVKASTRPYRNHLVLGMGPAYYRCDLGYALGCCAKD